MKNKILFLLLTIFYFEIAAQDKKAENILDAMSAKYNIVSNKKRILFFMCIC